MPLDASNLKSGPAAPLVRLSSDFIRAKEYLEAILLSSRDAICTTDTAGRIIYFSPGAESMVGVSAARMAGRHAHEVYEGGIAEALRIMRLLRKNGSIQDYEVRLKAADGRRIHASLSASLLKDRDGRVIGTLGISKDITPRVELEKRLRELSITDDLTGLHNKRHFRERLAQECGRARRQGYPLSLVILDMDGFKRLNDLKGHVEGDRVLKAFAGILLKSVRAGVDSAYRYGGDEFVVLLPGLARPQAERVARRLLTLARETLVTEKISFSYGIASLTLKGSGLGLLREADKRLFRMKKTRRA